MHSCSLYEIYMTTDMRKDMLLSCEYQWSLVTRFPREDSKLPRLEKKGPGLAVGRGADQTIIRGGMSDRAKP